jgi:hypothetical protein
MSDTNSPAKINFKKFTITSFVFGFFLVPIHEFGHVICDWITGHPAGMSYARDYLLSGGQTQFICAVASAALGICIVERFVFPKQFHIQFGG